MSPTDIIPRLLASSTRTPNCHTLISAAGYMVGLMICCSASGADLPAEKQAFFLARAITYDTNLKDRAGASVNIGILAKKGNPDSEKMADTVTKAFLPLEATTMLGLPVRLKRLAFAGRDALEKGVREAGIDTLYVCISLDDDLADIVAVARRNRVLTVASQEAYIKHGLSLGVFSIHGKNSILVNLEASRQEGVAFGLDLLRLATVIK
jgi:hypothetical protein